ncbi:MAG: alpha/beta fold hydrolase, partial [Acidobacteria bacterium]|nr:alpha/beta fold hydrolase [Acidobacteriota bacterium]
MTAPESPHRDQPVAVAGLPPEEASAAVLMVHGRGATAESILSLRLELGIPGIAYLAPQARGFTWYPASFLAPLEVNEPGISKGIEKLDSLVRELDAAGIPPHRTVILGFSQGACLSLEFASRHPRRYGGVLAFTGGLIGPPGTRWNEAGSLEGTPVFLGSGDPDPH